MAVLFQVSRGFFLNKLTKTAKVSVAYLTTRILNPEDVSLFVRLPETPVVDHAVGM
ncbi:uncharacterized protein ANIA_11336 [Aspergillus nidulans FGSC A4]|uniref:Uncharacterized protein n=1 Tax=Emericella nidulans (strain FGSC A4 / ATCC 38163 / CBS 112.46 / NRRL 194 / M139) TaxID=227321 RepID=C8VNP9_EMENI|nr:hypothetical protein [Aspergillus nidulans FGSC A4]CBF86751.1 TPA: hypothetical protein ANIA_11336 [Aspergillus nidulans FGSC A4]